MHATIESPSLAPATLQRLEGSRSRGDCVGATAASVPRPGVHDVPVGVASPFAGALPQDAMPNSQPGQPSASAQVVTHVKEAIRSGRLAPGQRLLESELTTRLGMSRGPVREALAQLQVEGFIDVEPHRGARVHQMSRDEMTDLFQVRALLAGDAARAMRRHITATLRTIVELPDSWFE